MSLDFIGNSRTSERDNFNNIILGVYTQVYIDVNM